MIWSKNMYARLSYEGRLREVQAPTLVLAGRHDLEASLPFLGELFEGIPDSRLVVFENNGHAPFEHERDLFKGEVRDFLNGKNRIIQESRGRAPHPGGQNDSVARVGFMKALWARKEEKT